MVSRRSIALRRAVALVLIPIVAAGCASWQTADVEPRALIESEHPSKVRVMTRDSARYVVHGPRIAADTLFGLRGKDSVAVDLQAVIRVDVQRFSPGKTAAFFLVLGGVVGGVVLVLNSSVTGCC